MKKARSLPQISGVMVMVLHRNMVSPQMVSPQNDVTRGGPPPLATSLVFCIAIVDLSKDYFHNRDP